MVALNVIFVFVCVSSFPPPHPRRAIGYYDIKKKEKDLERMIYSWV